MSSRLSFSFWTSIAIYVATSVAASAASPTATSEELGTESSAKLKLLTAAITKKPKDKDPYIERGLFYLAADDDEKALADFNKAIALDPASCRAYYCRGDLYMRTEEFAKASVDYTKSGDLGPVASVKGLAYQQAGRALAKAGNLASSLTMLDRALPLVDNGRKPLVLLSRAETHLALKQYTATVTDIDSISKEEKIPRENAYGLKARALLALGKYEQAIPEYTQAIKLSSLKPNSLEAVIFATKTANYLKERAICFEKIGKKDLAALDRRKADRAQEDSIQFAPFR